jgi:hypothetical protein
MQTAQTMASSSLLVLLARSTFWELHPPDWLTLPNKGGFAGFFIDQLD